MFHNKVSAHANHNYHQCQWHVGKQQFFKHHLNPKLVSQNTPDIPRPFHWSHWKAERSAEPAAALRCWGMLLMAIHWKPGAGTQGILGESGGGMGRWFLLGRNHGKKWKKSDMWWNTDHWLWMNFSKNIDIMHKAHDYLLDLWVWEVPKFRPRGQNCANPH